MAPKTLSKRLSVERSGDDGVPCALGGPSDLALTQPTTSASPYGSKYQYHEDSGLQNEDMLVWCGPRAHDLMPRKSLGVPRRSYLPKSIVKDPQEELLHAHLWALCTVNA